MLAIMWYRTLSSSLLSKNIKIKIHRTIILPVLLYGCDTWTLTLREVHRLRVYQNRVLGRIFGLRKDEVTGNWRRLHNKELSDLYSSPNIIQVITSKRMRQAGQVTCIGWEMMCIQVFGGGPEGMKALRRPRHRWKNNIKVHLQEVG
jgi:hypothetical protein